MKKVLFTLGILLCGLAAEAQEWSIGPVVGINQSWMSDMDNDKAKTGFNAGFVVTYSNFEHLGIGLAPRFSREGARVEENGVEMTTTLDYIRVPLQFNIFLNSIGDDFRPKIYIGPQVGFLVGGETEMFTEDGLGEMDARDVYDNTEFGLLMGAGFNYRIAEATWLNLDLQYNHGLSDVAENLDHKNRTVSLNLGVAFGF